MYIPHKHLNFHENTHTFLDVKSSVYFKVVKGSKYVLLIFNHTERRI